MVWALGLGRSAVGVEFRGLKFRVVVYAVGVQHLGFIWHRASDVKLGPGFRAGQRRQGTSSGSNQCLQDEPPQVAVSSRAEATLYECR